MLTRSPMLVRQHGLEADGHVAEHEVEVDEQGLGPGRREVGRQVRRQRRLADSALGGEDSDDLAPSLPRVRRGRTAGR